MSRYEFKALEDNILKDEILKHVSKKFYKSMKHIEAEVFVNGSLTKTYQSIKAGDIITIDYDKTPVIDWPLYESKLDIAYEDDHYLVVNKRSGLLAIPTKAEPKSLYQEVLFYLKNKGDELNISILNRLDKDTEGLCVIAKGKLAAFYLDPVHVKIKRKYVALCEGIFDEKIGTINLPIYKNGDSHIRIIDERGQKAITHYRVIKEIDNRSLVEFVLETGRTHQIRLHSKAIGHPLVGDILYGNSDVSDLHLQSYYVEFVNPFTNKLVKLEIEHKWN